ncbi:MAG: DUF3014 domain-containing protein [Propionivibrio sp.]
MKGKHWAIGTAVVAIAALAGYIFLVAPQEVPPPVAIAPPAVAPTVQAQTEPPRAAPEPPAILHPIEATPSEEPLPELGKSDAPFRKALGEVIGKKGLALVLSDELIHHLVVTIDNLPRKHLAADVVPLKRAEGKFNAEGKDETLSIGAGNAARYAAYAAAIKAVDSAKLVAVYRRFYPLFERAYHEIGYPQAHFNDRLVAAIDDLLSAPDPEVPVRLVQPKILYEYADPDLEARSAGQKIMMRIGRENAALLKARLREIRRLVASGQ